MGPCSVMLRAPWGDRVRRDPTADADSDSRHSAPTPSYSTPKMRLYI